MMPGSTATLRGNGPIWLRDHAMTASRRPDRSNAPKLTLHRPEAEALPRPKDVAFWRINGYRAAMLVWTDTEYERLADWERPAHAQRLSFGLLAVPPMVSEGHPEGGL